MLTLRNCADLKYHSPFNKGNLFQYRMNGVIWPEVRFYKRLHVYSFVSMELVFTWIYVCFFHFLVVFHYDMKNCVCVCLCQRKAYALCLNEMLHIFALQTSYHLVLSTIYCSLHFSFIAIRIRIYLSLFISNYFRMVFLVVFMNSLSLSQCFNSCLPILCALWFLAVCLFVCV